MAAKVPRLGRIVREEGRHYKQKEKPQKTDWAQFTREKTELSRIGCENSSYSLLCIYLLPGTVLALCSHVLFDAHYTPTRQGVTFTLQRSTSRLKQVAQPQCKNVYSPASTIPDRGDNHNRTGSPFLWPTHVHQSQRRPPLWGLGKAGFPLRRGRLVLTPQGSNVFIFCGILVP